MDLHSIKEEVRRATNIRTLKVLKRKGRIEKDRIVNNPEISKSAKRTAIRLYNNILKLIKTVGKRLR